MHNKTEMGILLYKVRASKVMNGSQGSEKQDADAEMLMEHLVLKQNTHNTQSP